MSGLCDVVLVDEYNLGHFSDIHIRSIYRAANMYA